MIAQESAFLKSRAVFGRILDSMNAAVQEGKGVTQIEKELHGDLQELGRTVMQESIEAHGTGDLGPTVEHDGRVLRRLEGARPRRFVTIFGEITFRRFVYAMRETQKYELIPLDAMIQLPDSEFSYLLEDWSQSLCVQASFDQSRTTLERILGFGLTVRGMEHMNVQMAQDVGVFLDGQNAPPAQEEGEILVVTADGKGVPMRRDHSEKPLEDSKRRKKGEKANKKRQACVGGVYTIDRFIRSPEHVVDSMLRQAAAERRPEPLHKRLHAELTREIGGQEVKGKELTFTWLAGEVELRRQAEQPLVCLMDGDPALWAMQEEYLPDAVGILDIYHVMERLWLAAHCFHREGTVEAEKFVEERLGRILEGEVGRVIGGLRQMATKQGLHGRRLRELQRVVGYLENNRRFMRYGEYLAAGYPIGSGVVEGACRHLVKDRMEGTGMRWRVRGAQSMLNLRAVWINGDWDEFQHHRQEHEQGLLYPYRDFVEDHWRRAA